MAVIQTEHCQVWSFLKKLKIKMFKKQSRGKSIIHPPYSNSMRTAMAKSFLNPKELFMAFSCCYHIVLNDSPLTWPNKRYCAIDACFGLCGLATSHAMVLDNNMVPDEASTASMYPSSILHQHLQFHTRHLQIVKGRTELELFS